MSPSHSSDLFYCSLQSRGKEVQGDHDYLYVDLNLKDDFLKNISCLILGRLDVKLFDIIFLEILAPFFFIE